MISCLIKSVCWLVAAGHLLCIKGDGADSEHATGACERTVEMTIDFDGKRGFKNFEEYMKTKGYSISIDTHYDDTTFSTQYDTTTTAASTTITDSPTTEEWSPPCEDENVDKGCFWISTTGIRNMTYNRGVEKCNEGRSSLARVRTENDYALIMEKLRKHLKPKTAGGRERYATAWIDGTITPGNSPRNSNRNRYIKWFPYGGYPKRNRGRTHLTLYADIKGEDHEGMLNMSPAVSVLAVACYYAPTY